MNRRQAILLGVLAAFALLVIALAFRNPQPPRIPTDEPHAAASSTAACLTCHGEGGSSPRDANHPVGNDCSRCHGWQP